MKRILDEPPCRASMKNFGKTDYRKELKVEKNKIEALQLLDGALRRDKAENLELRKGKMKHLEPSM